MNHGRYFLLLFKKNFFRFSSLSYLVEDESHLIWKMNFQGFKCKYDNENLKSFLKIQNTVLEGRVVINNYLEHSIFEKKKITVITFVCSSRQ